jgi:hypothetical protein
MPEDIQVVAEELNISQADLNVIIKEFAPPDSKGISNRFHRRIEGWLNEKIFRLTQQDFDELRDSASVPVKKKNTSLSNKKLAQLLDQDFKTEEDFLYAAESILGKEQVNQYEDFIELIMNKAGSVHIRAITDKLHMYVAAIEAARKLEKEDESYRHEIDIYEKDAYKDFNLTLSKIQRFMIENAKLQQVVIPNLEENIASIEKTKSNLSKKIKSTQEKKETEITVYQNSIEKRRERIKTLQKIHDAMPNRRDMYHEQYIKCENDAIKKETDEITKIEEQTKNEVEKLQKEIERKDSELVPIMKELNTKQNKAVSYQEAWDNFLTVKQRCSEVGIDLDLKKNPTFS